MYDPTSIAIRDALAGFVDSWKHQPPEADALAGFVTMFRDRMYALYVQIKHGLLTKRLASGFLAALTYSPRPNKPNTYFGIPYKSRNILCIWAEQKG
jgi:hypothetical protein